jgi:hypothetical protein
MDKYNPEHTLEAQVEQRMIIPIHSLWNQLKKSHLTQAFMIEGR